MGKKRTLNEIRQVKDSVYEPKYDLDNVLPDEYWNALSQSLEDVDQSYNTPNWDEMDTNYYHQLRERLNKGEDEVGPRHFKQYQSTELPIQSIVIPAGRQHDGEKMVAYYHIIVEDMELGECNGYYQLVTEEQLEKEFNIKYNN